MKTLELTRHGEGLNIKELNRSAINVVGGSAVCDDDDLRMELREISRSKTWIGCAAGTVR